MRPLLDMIDRHKAGQCVGRYSVCSAHPLVIEAALRRAQRQPDYALVEATSNQVNQDGGYTGMRPADFVRYVHGIAARVGLPRERVLLGGDHLGPNSWQQLDAETAMRRAERLVADYVEAGFRKIHLDCSMACAGDPAWLGDGTVAARAARLCQAAERSWRRVGGEPPVYIVGTEVPVPGGAHEELTELVPTEPAAAVETLDAHRSAWQAAGLDDVWTRVVGLVVQPGVEFDHHRVIDFRPERAMDLSHAITRQSRLVYEAHSTDYQTPACLRALVRGHYAILKVGPALTFALREALWALAALEREWLPAERCSGVRETVLAAMAADPRHWEKYYLGSAEEVLLDLQYSLSDRVRYYWPVPAVEQAVERLLANLRAEPPPLTLLRQYLPCQYDAIRAGELLPDARALVLHHIDQVLGGYAAACSESGS